MIRFWNILKEQIICMLWTDPIDELYRVGVLRTRIVEVEVNKLIDCTSSDLLHQMPLVVPFVVVKYGSKERLYKNRYSEEKGKPYIQYEKRFGQNLSTVQKAAICKRVEGGFELRYDDKVEILEELGSGWFWMPLGDTSKARGYQGKTIEEAQKEAVLISQKK